MIDIQTSRIIVPLLLAIPLAGCISKTPAAQPAEIVVLTTIVTPAAVTVADDLPGRVVAFRTAEIRPQVGGIVQRRLFEQGAMVREGQPLFQINPAPYRADSDTAQATLQKASAAFERAHAQAGRLKALVAADVISRQSYDDVVAVREQAAAEVAEARATLRRRQLDVSFSRITAPISGRIGATNVTEGALVATSDLNPLATVQQIDRVYVDVRQPAERFAALRAAGSAVAIAEIILASGQVHPIKGKILFSGIAVDPTTGDALVRVEVDNPGERLLPGMFVRARLPRTTLPAALTLPQQAITRDANGAPQVSIVDLQDRVHLRRIKLGDIVNGRYLILSGLKPGEKVIVEGQDRVQPGTPVLPRPWRAR